jgi:hydrogenase expression/formation protein HypE
MSKFSLRVLQSRVYPFVGAQRDDVLLGTRFGEDAALTRVGETILASHVDPIVGAIKDVGWLAMHVGCNDIATSGIPPQWALVLVLVPSPDDDELIGEIMAAAHRAAQEIGVAIIGGHTGYSSGLSRPLVAVTALGTVSGQEPVRTSGAQVGDWVLVTKGVALEGTAILAQDFEDVALQRGLEQSDLEQARQLFSEVSVLPEALILAEHGVTAMHDVTRGGLLETLLEIADLSSVGIEIDASLLPQRPIVMRFAEALHFDPLKMISSGTLAATISPHRWEELAAALTTAGVPGAVVGRVADGAGVSVTRDGQTVRHDEIRCEDDELARMWALYPRS